MKKSMILTASILIFIGLALFVGAASAVGFDIAKLSTVKYETNTYDINEEFDSILINTDTSDVSFELSSDSTCKVVCYDKETAKHAVQAKDGVLNIDLNDSEKWYDYFTFSFSSTYIKVYLPEKEYDSLTIKAKTSDINIAHGFSFESISISDSTGDVKCRASAKKTMQIKTSTGDISVIDVIANDIVFSVSTGKIKIDNSSCEGSVSLSSSTGDMYLNDLACDALSCEGSTSDITLRNVIAKGNMNINVSTGDVSFESCDAAQIDVETSTGDVTGTLRSEKIFITHTSTGDINVPEDQSGGKCRIKTSTGDIDIKISK